MHYAKTSTFGQVKINVLCAQSSYKCPIACEFPNSYPDENIGKQKCNFVLYPNQITPMYLNKPIKLKPFDDDIEKDRGFYSRFHAGVFKTLYVQSKNPNKIKIDMDVHDKIGADLVCHIDETKHEKLQKFKKVFGKNAVYDEAENQVSVNKMEAEELKKVLIEAKDCKETDRRFNIGLRRIGRGRRTAPWWRKFNRRHNKNHRRPNYDNMPGWLMISVQYNFKAFP